VLALGALLSAALFVPLSNDAPRAPQEPQPEAAVPQAWIADDDAELLQKAAQSVKDEVTSEPAREVVARFNDIVLRVVSGELSQHEALRLSAELQAELETANGTGRMLQEGLAERGRTLGEHNATRSIGEALAERRYSDAAEAMRRLSERLQADTKGLSEQELEELRASLEALRKDREQESTQSDESPEEREQRKALEKRRDELRKKSEQGSASAAERQELKETERRLKRLDRQKKRQQEAKQALSELDRQLAEAARALAEEKKKSGEFLDQAARSVKQAQKRVLSDEEKKQLIKRLQELKERLRRKREEGAREENLRDFQKRARGKKPGSQTGGEQKEGQQGQQGQQSLELELSQMSQSPVPGGTKPGQGNGEPEGRDAPTGDEPGSSHDPQLEGKESKLSDAQTTDVTAVAQDSGGGASESETIATAAEEGFTRGGYQKLFVEYRTVAEEIMERETIPPGRKAHVRRYFELIRPRENAPVRRKEE
jgi:myosin heavy subunit